MKKISISIGCVFLLTHLTLEAQENIVKHYLEANISANYILTGGDRLESNNFFASGFHIAHGSNITPVHALVLSYGKDFNTNENSTLTTKAFFLRRYLPKFSSINQRLYSTIGSGSYRYEKSNTSIVAENAGIIIGFGVDWIYSDKLRFSLEADYRGFNIRQFDGESTDFVRPFTAFLGLRYYYHSTKYTTNPKY